MRIEESERSVKEAMAFAGIYGFWFCEGPRGEDEGKKGTRLEEQVFGR